MTGDRNVMADEPDGRISLENGDALDGDAAEIARVWINGTGGASAWIAAYRLEDPRIFGYLMADTVRHAARAYAGTWSLDQGEALQAIVDGFGEQLRDQFGNIETIQEGKLN